MFLNVAAKERKKEGGGVARSLRGRGELDLAIGLGADSRMVEINKKLRNDKLGRRHRGPESGQCEALGSVRAIINSKYKISNPPRFTGSDAVEAFYESAIVSGDPPARVTPIPDTVGSKAKASRP